MINNSIEQNQSQLNQTEKSNFVGLFDEYVINESKSFIKEFEETTKEKAKEIPGIPKDIDEIKINQMPQNTSDEPVENFLKKTTEYDKAYSFEVPKNPEDKKEKEEIKLSKEQEFKCLQLFFELMKRGEQKQRIEEEKGIKKIKFKSIKDFHEACFKKFPKTDKYKNNPEQRKKDLAEFINSIDLFHILKMILNYNLNFEKLNNNIEDEKDNESFENSTDEEKNFLINESHDEVQFFT